VPSKDISIRIERFQGDWGTLLLSMEKNAVLEKVSTGFWVATVLKKHSKVYRKIHGK